MSLLLSSLKKADKDNQEAAQKAAAPAPAPQAAASPPPIADFDDMPGAAAEPAAAAAPAKEKELVEAGRVFRAGEDEGSGGRGKMLAVVGLLVVVLGGGGGVLYSGIVPGLTPQSVMQMFGLADPSPIAPISSGTRVPELSASAEGEELTLPEPLVDVQSDVDFASLQIPEGNSLETEEGRREYARRIAIVIGASDEEELLADDPAALGLVDPNAQTDLEVAEAAAAETEATLIIKTAALSRDTRVQLQSRTASDRELQRGVVIYNQDEPVMIAQAEGEDSAAEPTAVAQAETDSAPAADSAAAEKEAGANIKASMSGAERRRLLGEARAFYNSGAYDSAEAGYRTVLAKSPANLDALRGLALVAVATGRYQAAAATYLKILERYPNDPVAIADLTNLYSSADGDSANFADLESGLKRALGKSPTLDGRIHFALGNLYAGNRRWLDAQKAYFAAHSSAADNPDYAYNLAVVLDYLNKPELALNYYREALSLAEQSPSGFNAAEVEARINDILQ